MYAAFADATESTVLTVACEEHEVKLFDAAVMRFVNSIRAWKCALRL